MYEDQSGEFVWGSWGLKGLTSDTPKTFSKINSAIKSDMVVRIKAAEFFLTNPIYVLRAFVWQWNRLFSGSWNLIICNLEDSSNFCLPRYELC